MNLQRLTIRARHLENAVIPAAILTAVVVLCLAAFGASGASADQDDPAERTACQEAAHRSEQLAERKELIRYLETYGLTEHPDHASRYQTAQTQAETLRPIVLRWTAECMASELPRPGTDAA